MAYRKVLGTLCFAALLLTLFSASVATANPIMQSMVDVTSPQNGRTYTSNDIELTFTVMPGYNLSSATYSLDGQAAKPTNGSTHLGNLPSGSHKITIYGTYTYTHTATNDSYSNENKILQTVNFSINYNTNQITFAATVSALLIAACFAAFLGRKRLVKRLKGGENRGVLARFSLPGVFRYCACCTPCLANAY